jgi:ABC-type amino acid transport substrate-binding protein
LVIWHAPCRDTVLNLAAQRILSNCRKLGKYKFGGIFPESPPGWRRCRRAELDQALQAGSVRAFVLDRSTYEERVRQVPHTVIAQSGRLISVRLP